MGMDRKLGIGLAATLGLLFGNLAAGLALWPGLFPRPAYLATDLLALLLAALLLLLGFRLSQQGSRVVPRALVAAAAILAAWAPLEIYVTYRLCQTSGIGGMLCQTHVNWLDRVPTRNQFGFWEDDLAPYLAGGRRDETVLAVVGDSWTFGQGLASREERFTDRLGRALPGVRVLNFGQPGASTGTQARTLVPLALRVRPDVILVAYWGDDIASSGLPDGVEPEVPRKMNRLDRVAVRPQARRPGRFEGNHPLVVALPLVNYGFWRLGDFGTFHGWAEPYEDPVIFEDHARQLRGLLHGIHSGGARPVVALLPCHPLVPDGPPARRDRIYAALNQVFQATGTPVIPLQDLEDRFPLGHYEVNPMDPHPGPALQAAIADGIGAWFRKHPEFLKRRD